MRYDHPDNWTRHFEFENIRLGQKKFTDKKSYKKYLLIKRERDALIQFYFRIFSYIRNVEEQLFLSSFSKIEGGKERITERIMGLL